MDYKSVTTESYTVIELAEEKELIYNILENVSSRGTGGILCPWAEENNKNRRRPCYENTQFALKERRQIVSRKNTFPFEISGKKKKT